MVCAAKAPLSKSIGGNVQVTVNFTVGLCQLSMLVNIAAAGHKLQGQTKSKAGYVSLVTKKELELCGTFPCADQRGSLLSTGITTERSCFNVTQSQRND